MASDYQLRLTRRALADLGLPADLARLHAASYADRHEVVRAFVKRRGQTAIGPEATFLPATKVPVYNLHAGRHRGLTWHDEENGVCWLLGVGWHEQGSVVDAYAVLKVRDERNELFPTAEDYRGLVPDPADFVRDLRAAGFQLRQRALASPGEPSDDMDIAGALDVSMGLALVDVDDEVLHEVSLRFRMPPKTEGVLPPDWVVVAVAALLPEAELSDLEYPPEFMGRPCATEVA